MARKKQAKKEAVKEQKSTSFVKYISMFLISLTLLVFILMVFNKIDPLAFWIWIILLALVAYKGIPYLRKKGI